MSEIDIFLFKVSNLIPFFLCDEREKGRPSSSSDDTTDYDRFRGGGGFGAFFVVVGGGGGVRW